MISANHTLYTLLIIRFFYWSAFFYISLRPLIVLKVIMEANFPWSKTCDAHTHAHDDVEHLEEIANLKTDKICLMGTRLEDLDVVSQLATDFQMKVIPCFGTVFLSIYKLFI
jgi:hypothetical protein